MISQEQLTLAEQICAAYALCDACLGRYFRQDKKTTNLEVGQVLRKKLKISKAVDPGSCWLCEGLLGEITHFADLLKQKLTPYEYQSFLVGTKIDEDILEKEQELLSKTTAEAGDCLKLELNREIGKILESDLQIPVDFTGPEIMAVVDTQFDVVSLQIKSLYIYGRYRKLARGVPQTKWYCPICRGHGCENCNYTGTLYETSVEELISTPALDLTKGAVAAFHGSGREDIDARMLGEGRPFILEIKNPQIRTIDLKKFEAETNATAKGKVEISQTKFTSKADISRIKNLDAKKYYEIIVAGEKPFSGEKLKEQALLLQGSTIQQYTPTRVAHRRADKLRERKIYTCQVISVEGARATLRLETQSGTYIKELISGDNGRTTPNLSDLIGFPCTVTSLDVLAVKGE
jgi:tRNA pseudouridine synthase 10